eukprot:501655-Pyramimonas_sp.AAC.1
MVPPRPPPSTPRLYRPLRAFTVNSAPLPSTPRLYRQLRAFTVHTPPFASLVLGFEPLYSRSDPLTACLGILADSFGYPSPLVRKLGNPKT